MPPQKQTTDPFGYGLATAGFASLGGVIAPLTALPVGAAAVLCGLPAAVAAAIAGRKPGMFAAVALATIGAGGITFDGLSPAAIASSVFVIASAIATLAIATTRRRRHERTVVGLERLNHQILGDATRRPEYHAETAFSSDDSHEAALLALHELERRVATHASQDTLLPTIIAATKTLTSSRYAAVYLWNPRTRSLVDALAPRSRDIGCYIPDPATGAAGWVIATQQVYTAAAADVNAELTKATAGDSRRPAGIAPLIAGNDLLGLLIADGTERHAPVSPGLLCNIANIGALGLRNVRLLAQSTDAARRDPVTGLIDRSWMATAIEELIEQRPEAQSFGVISGRIDQLKDIDARCGRDAADAALQETRNLWKAALPDQMIAFRVSFESFLAVLPQSDFASAQELAEQIRESVACHPMLFGESPRSITMSLGVAEWRWSERPWHELLVDVEDAQQRSHLAGGDRVTAVDPALLAEG